MDEMLRAEEYYRDVYDQVCLTHTDYMEFANYYAGYTYAYDRVAARKEQEPKIA
jgi:hypothetical protein